MKNFFSMSPLPKQRMQEAEDVVKKEMEDNDSGKNIEKKRSVLNWAARHKMTIIVAVVVVALIWVAFGLILHEIYDWARDFMSRLPPKKIPD